MTRSDRRNVAALVVLPIDCVWNHDGGLLSFHLN